MPSESDKPTRRYTARYGEPSVKYHASLPEEVKAMGDAAAQAAGITQARWFAAALNTYMTHNPIPEDAPEVDYTPGEVPQFSPETVQTLRDLAAQTPSKALDVFLVRLVEVGWPATGLAAEVLGVSTQRIARRMGSGRELVRTGEHSALSVPPVPLPPAWWVPRRGQDATRVPVVNRLPGWLYDKVEAYQYRTGLSVSALLEKAIVAAVANAKPTGPAKR